MLRTLLSPMIALSLAATTLVAQDTSRVDARDKNPTTARIYGIIPGAGHMYAGEVLRGLSYYLITTGLFASIAVAEWDCLDSSSADCGRRGDLFFVAGVAVWGWSIYDAGRAAERTNAKYRLRVSLIVMPGSSRRGDARSGRGLRVGLTLPNG